MAWAIQSADFSSSVSAECAVLMTADTGAVLFEKDAHLHHSMASTTKIMTALLALEAAETSGDSVVDITNEMVQVEGSSMGLQTGDQLHLSALAQGMLLASGNDAANAAALFLSGTQEAFADKMNERAVRIGMADTHFVTPSGLDDEDHFSTAYDMALLAREALKNPWFVSIASSSSMQVDFVSPEKQVTYTNHNKLLGLYEGCIGLKTGFTKKSGRCLVSAAERDGVTLICVTFNAPDDWDDHIALLDYGFSQVSAVSFDGRSVQVNIPVTGGVAPSVAVQGALGGTVSLPRESTDQLTQQTFLPPFLYAPIHDGDKVGYVQFYLNGKPVYDVPIVAKQTVDVFVPEPSFWEKLFSKNKKQS